MSFDGSGARVVLTTAGSVTAAMSFDGSTIIGKAVVTPETSLVTGATTAAGVITWNPIDPGAAQDWTEINVGASQTWTNVET
jgi:hypothetical protein